MDAKTLAMKTLQNVTNCKYLYEDMVEPSIRYTMRYINEPIDDKTVEEAKVIVIKVLSEN